ESFEDLVPRRRPGFWTHAARGAGLYRAQECRSGRCPGEAESRRKKSNPLTPKSAPAMRCVASECMTTVVSLPATPESRREGVLFGESYRRRQLDPPNPRANCCESNPSCNDCVAASLRDPGHTEFALAGKRSHFVTARLRAPARFPRKSHNQSRP